MTAEALRNKDLARIHLAKKQLGLDDDAYRALLQGTTGKASAKDLTTQERWKVLQAMQQLGAKAAAKPFPGRPARQDLDKESLIRKIEAQLAEAKRPWGYAHAIAKRMFQVDQVQWCEPAQLVRIVAALNYDANRNNRTYAP